MMNGEIQRVMQVLFKHRAPNPPQALADVFDRLIWCMADNGAAMLEIREIWLLSDERPRVEIALAMDEIYPFETALEMENVLARISAKWPDLSERCQHLITARNAAERRSPSA